MYDIGPCKQFNQPMFDVLDHCLTHDDGGELGVRENSHGLRVRNGIDAAQLHVDPGSER